MHLIACSLASAWTRSPLWPMLFIALLAAWRPSGAHGMTDDEVSRLRSDTVDLFYHGYDNYMNRAFPEDELKPISCKPQTRNRHNVADIGLNDVLGNYSLTLIDSLSTLAILASGPRREGDERHPLHDFQHGVKSLVELYGDGTAQGLCGKRACGFDLDSKVQVFETNIRGVGGLLSAHLFAIGELPISGYSPAWIEGRTPGIRWKNGMVYDGQLLRLAGDLARRLLPAFNTPTDIPYPRVNLRTGIPFYRDAEQGFCRVDGTKDPKEITENCAAGAGSLVLEFATLSRLTGDPKWERVAKKAFWAIWNRRSDIGLVGNGIDAETGEWTRPALSGIGAGIDSFFEYSIKSHILLSGLPYNTSHDTTDSPDSFLRVWEQAHAAVRRHIYRPGRHEKHPYYGQVDTFTGGARYNWIDNLSAYYPGLLVLAGALDEAIESHLLFGALWTKYGALPERWQTSNSYIDPNFKHWAGRPEFIESTFYLYQATRDPYYLHVGEMALRDIRRRCWTKCGWTDLSDVTNGQQRDRMESFFLGETAKYLYLLFTEHHPLNKLDRPVVFTTEGHPLVLPDSYRKHNPHDPIWKAMRQVERAGQGPTATCRIPPPNLPLTVSNTANRADLFHAAALAQLHLVPVQPSRPSPLMKASKDTPGISYADVRSPSNYTFYPWTLPASLIPAKGMSAPIVNPIISTLTFPTISNGNAGEGESGLMPFGAVKKTVDGILINSLSNMRLSMVQESKNLLLVDSDGELLQQPGGEHFRIHGIANWALGKDEKVLLTREALKGVSPSDPHFTKVKDLEMVDLVLDTPAPAQGESVLHGGAVKMGESGPPDGRLADMVGKVLSRMSPNTSSQVRQFRVKGKDGRLPITRQYIPAILPTGIGAAPVPSVMDLDPLVVGPGQLPHGSIFFLDDTLCRHRVPSGIANSYQVLIIRRGECSFNDKLMNIPSFTSGPSALQLVVVVSGLEIDRAREPTLIRPLLDQIQLTPNGVERRHPIAMCMVDGSQAPPTSDGRTGSTDAVSLLKRASSSIASFDKSGTLVEAMRERGHHSNNGDAGAKSGIGVKRRYWFESMGVPIGNLLLV